ncbi:EAL domain-containing protein [Granulicella sp. WH15]|uniref:EAL domain-containing protein n=1 Tax=Granulicella sp. WH15 TaxID=2602070 RepID=UPI00136759D8|nr:EAL domain-containing protein [Granulicella sp. WH15]QHN02505.1 EAL domain-containing protein [Granulicella sp. WH15]
MSRRPVLMLSRTPLARILLFFSATLLGAFLAFTLSRLIGLHSERAALARGSHRLLDQGNLLGMEIRQSLDHLTQNPPPACSDSDIAFMRDLVFSSLHIRDVGRMHEGRLLCAAGVGRLAQPVDPGAPSFTVRGAQVWPAANLMASPASHGFMIEQGGVFVVLNPETLTEVLDPAPHHATGFLYDQPTGRMVRVSGEPVPLSVAEIAASRFLVRDHVFYQPLCTPTSTICTVVYERCREYEARTRSRVVLRTLGGAILGALFALSVITLDIRCRSMESQLRRAIRHGCLTLVYQPIVDLATEVVTGAEALVRWVDEDGEEIGPEVFIALAESKGFVTGITRLVMHRVVEELSDLLAQGRLRISLNITAQDLQNPSLLEELNLCMDTAQIHHSLIGLELTERSTADHGLSSGAIARLKQAGYYLYIDDFGTGYSSLAYLHQLSADAIKIDRTFTHLVGAQADGSRSVTSSVVLQILEMARLLELQVVVEGIETPEQSEYFRRTLPGIAGQGWLYSKPLTAPELRKLLQETSSRKSTGKLF